MTRWGKKEELELRPLMDQPAKLIDAMGERARQPMASLARDSSLSALDWERAKGLWSKTQDYSRPMPLNQREAIERALGSIAHGGLFYPATSHATVEAMDALARMPATLAFCAMRDESATSMAIERLPNRAVLWGASMATEALESCRKPQPALLDAVLFESAARLEESPGSLIEKERSDIVASLMRRIRAWPLFAQNEEEMGRRAEELMGTATTLGGRLLLSQALAGAFVHGDMNVPRGARLIERVLDQLSETEAEQALRLAVFDCPDFLSSKWAMRASLAKRLNPWQMDDSSRPDIFNALSPGLDSQSRVNWPSPRVKQIIECFGEPTPEAASHYARLHFRADSLTGALWWIDRGGLNANGAIDKVLMDSAARALWTVVATEGGWGLTSASPSGSVMLAQRVNLAERCAVWLDQAAARSGVSGAPMELLEALSPLSPVLGSLAEARAIREEMSPRATCAKNSRALSL